MSEWVRERERERERERKRVKKKMKIGDWAYSCKNRGKKRRMYIHVYMCGQFNSSGNELWLYFAVSILWKEKRLIHSVIVMFDLKSKTDSIILFFWPYFEIEVG